MLLDRGANDLWVRVNQLKRDGVGRWSVPLQEPLGWTWENEIVTYPLPLPARVGALRVTIDGEPTPAQKTADGKSISLRVPSLAPGQTRRIAVERAARWPTGPEGVSVTDSDEGVVASTGAVSVLLPASTKRPASPIPGPILSVRRGGGAWFGRGRIESPVKCRSITTRVAERGPLWTAVEVVHRFEGGSEYRVRVTLRAGEEHVEVAEDSTLPLDLWPMPRPFREIGSLGTSFWSQPLDAIGLPCERPCPTAHFRLDFSPDFEPERMLTHATAAIQMMDLPLRWGGLRTYTALRACYVGVDAAWMGLYRCDRDELFGIASLDIAHWRLPDDALHPAHRIGGANAEVVLVDSVDSGPHLRFPIQQVSRRWFLAAFSRAASPGLGDAIKPAGQPVPLESEPRMPLWRLRTRRGDLRLDKVKDWVTHWPDAGHEHPRVYCSPKDLPGVRDKILATPELKRNYDATRQWRPADRLIVEGGAGLGGEKTGGGALEMVEKQTKAGALIAQVLERGFASQPYAIGLTRPLRRYIAGVDVLWPTLTPEERATARRVIALGAYLATDGDWWSFPWRENESTYLPNFNSDVFTCAGTAGLFLSDHPCSKIWIKHLVTRMDAELREHLRLDGGGSENVGCYLVSTWSQLLLPALWALRHAGVKDYSRDPHVLAGARFLVKVISSPDPRAGWQRMMPPIGHHPHAKMQLPLLAWMAAFVKKSDPALARNLMWAWREMGSPVRNFYDHQGAPANPLTRHYLFHDPSIKPAPPGRALHESTTLPNVGTLFRTHGLTRQGSYVFLKAGREHSHHDEDEGSFHYFGRGVPLALDGLRLENGAPASEHNTVTFGAFGQPTGRVECFRSTPVADYVRAVMPPRGYCSDTNFYDRSHRSGWERQLLLIKSRRPGGVEYLVVKDVASGPDPAQWNLDVLSREPRVVRPGHYWFPGHEAWGMGMDLVFAEPTEAAPVIERGKVNEAILDPARRAALESHFADYTVNEHWIAHLPGGAGATFVAVLFPRREGEAEPRVEYLAREETLRVTHGEGRDLIFLRPSAAVDVILEDVDFQGRAGVAVERGGKRVIQPLDAVSMRRVAKASHGLQAFR